MSKERAKARAARAAEAAQREAREQERRAKLAAERARRERRSLIWRRARLWQHGSGFRRRKEGIAALCTVALLALVLAYFLTGSLGGVLLVALVLIVATPALVMLTFDRRRK